MRRRNFLKKIAISAGAPIAFQGVPIRLLGAEQKLARLSAASQNDRVLIILQMHGGNDGINTIVPLENYDLYYNRRSNIALPYKSGKRTIIPLDSTLPAEQQVGLHPDMTDFKSLYDNAKAAVVQGVSYKNNNGSHFRGRDIWFMGGNSDDYFASGWAGRYLNKLYEPLSYPDDFPNLDMPDPLALEMGNEVSLLFHQEGNIPTALALGSSPEQLAQLIAQLQGFDDAGVDPRGLPPAFLNDSPYGKEMNWILGLEQKSEDYIKRLQEVYQRAPESPVEYPDQYPFGKSRNPLSSQLRLVAKLLDGGGEGVKTKIFLLKIGGFDSHARQVEDYDSTLGGHAALLYHISSAMRAFQRDLAHRGLEDRVLTMTMSEFGRRIPSNGSYGTDHGTGGPVMLFGRHVNPGVFGNCPDLNDNNVALQYDYRQIYASILRDWLQVDEQVIRNDIFFGDFLSIDPGLQLARDTVLGTDPFIASRFSLEKVFPNPVSSETTLVYHYNAPHQALLEVIDANGKKMYQKNVTNEAGRHSVTLELSFLSPGIYHIRFQSEHLTKSIKIIKQ
ncbi:MAG: DUF1501 domain-containing protein [Cyclobacteriaceae bacterium]|nr:DUF1501 domain-containing protein [Cyclobacteriaceae bacterium]